MPTVGTKEAASILGVPPSRLARAVYEGRIKPEPAKRPGGPHGIFVWSREDLRRASLVLLKRELGSPPPTRKGA